MNINCDWHCKDQRTDMFFQKDFSENGPTLLTIMSMSNDPR